MEEYSTINPSAMPENKQIRHAARERLSGNWLYAVLCTLLFYAVTSVAGSIPLAGLLVVCPLAFGFSIAFLHLVRSEVEGDDLVTKPFSAFHQYGRMLGASLLVLVLTFLWSLLLWLIIAVVVLSPVLLIAGAVFFFVRRHRKKHPKAPKAAQTTSPAASATPIYTAPQPYVPNPPAAHDTQAPEKK